MQQTNGFGWKSHGICLAKGFPSFQCLFVDSKTGRSKCKYCLLWCCVKRDLIPPQVPLSPQRQTKQMKMKLVYKATKAEKQLRTQSHKQHATSKKRQNTLYLKRTTTKHTHPKKKYNGNKTQQSQQKNKKYQKAKKQTSQILNATNLKQTKRAIPKTNLLVKGNIFLKKVVPIFFSHSKPCTYKHKTWFAFKQHACTNLGLQLVFIFFIFLNKNKPFNLSNKQQTFTVNKKQERVRKKRGNQKKQTKKNV